MLIDPIFTIVTQLKFEDMDLDVRPFYFQYEGNNIVFVNHKNIYS